MSMDSDGTNRIVKQQIKQWYAEIQGERNAKLLDDELVPPKPRSSLGTLGRRLASAVAFPLAVIRQRLAQ